MADSFRSNGPLWSHPRQSPRAPELSGDEQADVAIIGGGIAGLLSALLLARRGRGVTLVEANTFGSGETGRTTAHLTEVLDAGYAHLEQKFGVEGTRIAAQASHAAIDSLETLCAEFAPDALFERVPSYKLAETDEQVETLREEAAAMVRAGLDARFTDEPLPLPAREAVTLSGQAQVHPGRLVAGLVRELRELGVRLLEHTRVTSVEDGRPCQVVTDRGRISARDVLVLTNVPISNAVAIQTKIASYRTYAIAGAVADFPPGLFEDCEKPYHYVRRQRTDEGLFVIVGGEDHRTGKLPSESPLDALLRYAMRKIPGFAPRYQWSGQIVEPSDGLPYIGRNAGAEHTYVATGFSGTGMTFGVLSAMLLTAAVEELESPWAHLFTATRIKPIAQAGRYVVENATFPSRLALDRLDRGENSPESIAPGEGRLVRSDAGRMLAMARLPDGALEVRSAVCPHLGCYVRFNGVEGSWDCPCHGSRFDLQGHVLNGPATHDLARSDEDLTASRPKPKRKPHSERQHRHAR